MDWPVSETDGFDRREFNTVLNAVAYGAYSSMAKIAGTLGKTADASTWQTHADDIKRGLIKQLYDSDKGAFRDGMNYGGAQEKSNHYSQHATAYALAFGIYDSQEMADKMADYIRSQGEIRTSVYGAYFLLEGLYNAGAGDIAMDLMTSSGTRSWDHMINDLGATITTEAWDPANKNNMTFSHPWGSAPASQIVRGLFGIRPTSGGFETFDITFQPGDVSRAALTIPTVKGSIHAHYTNSSKGISAVVKIPANTMATVTLPIPEEVENPYLVINGEIQKNRAAGLTATLGSGTYTLEIGSDSVVVEDPGRIAYFSFDNGTYGLEGAGAVAKIVPNDHVGDTGVVLTENGVSGRALHLFEGSCIDYLDVTKADGSSLLTDLDTATISYYSKVDGTSNSNWGFYAAPDDNGQTLNNEHYLGVLENNGARLSAKRLNGNRNECPSADSTGTAAEWNHIVVVYDVNETRLYVNGVRQATAANAHQLPVILGDDSVFYIGKANWGTNGEFYSGYIDEFSVFNYAMNDQQVANIGNPKWISTFDFDDATNGLSNTHAKATGNHELRTEDGRTALYLNGNANNYLTVTDGEGGNLLAHVTELTVSFDMKTTRTNAADWPFYAAPNDNDSGRLTYLGILHNNNRLAVERFYRNRFATPETTSYGNNSWHNVTAVFGYDETILYLDGVEIDRETSTFSIDEMLGDNGVFYIGRANWGTERFQGYLDNYTIANFAMNAEQVQDLIRDSSDTGAANVIYFDNAISRMEEDTILYSVNGGESWVKMEKVTADNAPAGEDVCLESLWVAEIPADAENIMFHGYYTGKGTNNYPAGCYTTAQQNIAQGLAQGNCFYGAPVVYELSNYNDNATPSVLRKLMGGNWAPVDEINRYGAGSNDIPAGDFTAKPQLYYGTSTFYDYYSDFELWSRMLESSAQAKWEDNWGDQPLHTWNLAISEYYKEEATRADNPVVPLYFGGARMLDNKGTSVHLQRLLANYVGPVQYGNGYSGLREDQKLKYDRGPMQYFPNQGLLRTDKLFTEEPQVEENGHFKNTFLKNSELPTPYFSESFIMGDNVFKTQLGQLYLDVDFPFEKDTTTGYWVFDSSQEKYSVRMKVEDDGTYFLERTGEAGYEGEDKGAVEYNDSPFFFPFTDPGEYTDNGEVGSSTSNLNYMFGSVIEIPFSLTEDRTIRVEGELRPTVFTFSGDDDVWIILEAPDGSQKLVLDIGGSHGAVSGAIDFTSGTFATSGEWSYLNGDNTAITVDKDGFINFTERNGVNQIAFSGQYGDYPIHSLTDLGINVNEYDPYKEYKIQIYYMERGLDQSNLRVSFNFEHNKQVFVEKEWSDGNSLHSDAYITATLYQVPDMHLNQAVVTPYYHIEELDLPRVNADAELPYFQDLEKYGEYGKYYVGGTKYANTIHLNANNSWKGGWLGLTTTPHNTSDVKEYSYFVAEPEVPAGYEVRYYDQDGHELELYELTLEDGSKVNAVYAQQISCKFQVKNFRKTGLELHKVTTVSGTEKPLAGVEFELYKANVVGETWTKAEETAHMAGTTDADGKLKFEGLIEGTYLLYEKQTDANAGHIVPTDPWKVTVAGDGYITILSPVGEEVGVTTTNNPDNPERPVENVVKIVNEPATKPLQITKVDAVDATKLLSGVEFTLEEQLADGTYAEATTYTTEDGIIHIEELTVGKTYRLTETKAAEDYSLLKNPLTIVVTENGITVDNNALTSAVINGVNTYLLTIQNRAKFVFPETGGYGISFLLLAGFILAWAGTFLIRIPVGRKGGRYLK